MRHFFSTRIRVVLIISALIAGAIAVIGSLTGESFLGKAVQTVLAPIRSGANSLTDYAEQIYDYVFSYEQLAAENEALKKQIAQMEEDSRLADSILRENERLNDLLGFKKDHEEYELVDGYVISRSSSEWISSVTVSKGTNHGIAVGMVALTANGEVVGLVTEVGANYCVIKTVLDSSLEISATVSTTGDSGMVRGGYVSGQEGYLRMDYLPSDAVIRNRDQVCTAGSTVYPKDLILGYVVDAGMGETGVSKYAILEPAANIDSLEQVFILTNYGQE